MFYRTDVGGIECVDGRDGSRGGGEDAMWDGGGALRDDGGAMWVGGGGIE